MNGTPHKTFACWLAILAMLAGALPTLAGNFPHWAFQPITETHTPTPNPTYAHNPIDAFIQDRLKKAALNPAPQADRTTLIRRLFLDMHGLPPSPERITGFVKSGDPAAYDKLVDEVLASPRYGERWTSHWLDIVRYADTHGYEVNTSRPNAWPYRDYVIDAFNTDKPYDRFVFEQLAGDSTGEDAATGFLVAAAVLLPGQIGKDDASKRLARQDALNEIVVATGETFLALSIGCARCHDHKFDPIPQRDYYAMQAFFAGVDYGERPIKDKQANPGKESSEDLEKTKESSPMVYAGKFRVPDKTYVLHRGDAEQKRDRVNPSVLSALAGPSLEENAPEQIRRTTLAHWIASRDNPLTARVMANRVWQYHFGIGLVDTPSDFGSHGSPPSHPQLLDWLAQKLIQGGWSIKHLHRLILTSHTYRQSNHIDPVAHTKDAECRLLWRFPSKRLEAESIRDSILWVSGRLNLKQGGSGFDFFKTRGGLSGFPPVEKFSGEGLRRMIYAHKIRMERVPVFGAFDCPDAGQAMPRRRQSMTAIQALNLFNSPFVNREAAAFSRQVQREVRSIDAQIERVFRLTLGRAPNEIETKAAFDSATQHGLSVLCRVLFNSNEFLFMP